MIIYLDTETNGLDSEEDDVLEISIIDDEGTILLDTLYSPIKQTSWPQAEGIHGITPAMCAGYPTLVDLMPQIAEIFYQYSDLVIYNSTFDLSFIVKAASAANVELPSITHHCAMQDFMEAVHCNRWQKLTVAAAVAGHEWTGEAHRALADAQACRGVWRWLRDRQQTREAAKNLTHADLASIDLDAVLESLEDSAAEQGVDGYLSNLTWTQRENLQAILNKCLVDWLNANLPR